MVPSSFMCLLLVHSRRQAERLVVDASSLPSRPPHSMSTPHMMNLTSLLLATSWLLQIRRPPEHSIMVYHFHRISSQASRVVIWEDERRIFHRCPTAYPCTLGLGVTRPIREHAQAGANGLCRRKNIYQMQLD